MANNESNKAVFLDRDGVLNQAKVIDGKSYPPQTLEEFVILPGVKDACEKLKRAGYLLIVVTNQPDVATGVQKKEIVDAMHQKLLKFLPIDAIYTCFHISADNCECRKPKPGMLIQASADHQIDFSMSCLVGDRWRDIEAGQQVGCLCYFIDYDYNERKPAVPFKTVASLESAAELIL